MLLYRISKTEFINDLSGYGAFLANNRWNSKGVFMLYTSAHISLSLLEVMVHVHYDLLVNMKFSLLTLQIDSNKIMDVGKLEDKWMTNEEKVRKTGDKWIASSRSLAMRVPSAIVPEEFNVLINPRHNDFRSGVKVAEIKPFEADKRLFANKFE